jgi:glycerophosphoryl diester phosphodiesterase
MRPRITHLGLAAVLTATLIPNGIALADRDDDDDREDRYHSSRYEHKKSKRPKVQLGDRPFYLIDEMSPSQLKKALKQCASGPFFKTDFSIGHRGAALQFPEHTKESYIAAARQGAGIIECDVTFTQDRKLVCRHAQCDLHTTTDILARSELAAKCSEPFVPADPANGTLASAKCCTSDITLAEFKSLCGKMDASNRNGTTVEEYLDGTLSWRTDLYTTCPTVLSHAESIELIRDLGGKFTPELKSPEVEMPYQGNYTQQDYAQQMIDEYKAAGIKPRNVWAQSFNLADVLYWIENEPRFGKQAVFLDSRPYTEPGFMPSLADFEALRAQGVRIVAPPMFALLTLDQYGEIVPSDYAELAKAAGLDIITWTIERSGRLIEDMKKVPGVTDFYYQTTLDAIGNDGDMMVTLDVLAKDVGIIGIFSDWPATVTYYANCMGLK